MFVTKPHIILFKWNQKFFFFLILNLSYILFTCIISKAALCENNRDWAVCLSAFSFQKPIEHKKDARGAHSIIPVTNTNSFL